MTGAFDLGNPDEFSSFFTKFINEDWPPIRGIVHAAGVAHDSRLRDLTSTVFYEVVGPKVIGGWLLHTLEKNYSLDFFIACSSAASIIASPGGGNYATANAFLGGLIQHRSILGFTGLCVDWGPIEGVGLAVLENRTDRLAARGVHAIRTQHYLAALERLLAEKTLKNTVMSVDWKTILHTFSENSVPKLLEAFQQSFLAGCREDEESIDKNQEKADDGSKVKSRQQVEALILSQISELLMEPASQLDRALPLQKIGFDSIMAVQLVNELEMHFNFNTSMNDIVQVSINSLTEQVVQSLHKS